MSDVQIGYVNTTVEDGELGSKFIGGQGTALEVLSFTFGAIAGGISAGFLSEIGKDLYSKIKKYYTRNRDEIENLREKHQQIRYWYAFCYAFVFEIDGKKIAVAFDVDEDAELEYCIQNAEKEIIKIIDDFSEQLDEDQNVLEIDIQINYPNRESRSAYSSYKKIIIDTDKEPIEIIKKLKSTKDSSLWMHHLKQIDK